MSNNTHIMITIKDPSRWWLSYGKIRKHYLQLHASIWSDPDFIKLSNDAKLLFLWLKNASLRNNNDTFSVCLESAYVSLRVSLGVAKGLLRELESNDFIGLQTKLRVPKEENRIEENKREEKQDKILDTINYSKDLVSLFSDDEIITWIKTTGTKKLQHDLCLNYNSTFLAEEIANAFYWQQENKTRKAGTYLKSWCERSNKKDKMNKSKIEDDILNDLKSLGLSGSEECQ